MQSWPVVSPLAPQRLAQRSLAGVIDAIGDASFAASALRSVNGALQAASWSVYRVWRDRAPVLHLSSSLGVRDTTRDCFRVYHDGLYRHDRSFDAARSHRSAAALLRLRASEFSNPDHREAIYHRHGVVERLSVVQPQDDGSLLAVNLYHHEHQGGFADGEIGHFEELSLGLLTAVRRHIALTSSTGSHKAASHDAAAPSAARPDAPALRAMLQRHHPAMPPRELDVCTRLLQGLSYDGIAADLGLSVATVKTYRRRAFDRMGLHFKSELFARFMGRG